MANSRYPDNNPGMDAKARLGRRIKVLRASANLSQEELAARSELSVDALSKVERGKSFPSLDTLLRLGAALGATPAELMSAIADDDPERGQLEAELFQIARSLDTPRLSLAIAQLRALAQFSASSG